MKKILLSFVAVVGLLATSCVQDATDDLNVGKQGVVTFAVDAQHTSRAYGIAAEATNLYYAVYQNGNLLDEISILPGETPVILTNGATNVSLSLATGLEYEFVFWAASPYAIDEDLYSFDWTNKTMTLNANALVASDESLDAFYKYDKFVVEGTATHPMILKRPFAQINVATGDTDKAANAGLTVAETWFEVSGAFDTLNLATGTASGAATLTYTAAAKPATTEKITANSKEYDLLGVIYVLANKDESPLNNVKFSYNRTKDGAAVKTIEVPSAPIKRNARTNLVGNILTSNNGFDVDIDEGFEDTFTLEDALANQISNGGVVTLTSDIVLNNNVTGFVISKDTEIDLAGNSITIPDTDASRAASSAKASIFTVEGDVNFTIKNGTIVIPSTNGTLNGTNASTGAGNAIIFDSTGKLVVENVTIEASKRGGWRAIEVYAGEAEINNSTINCYYGSGVNSAAKVTLNNCDITVNGMYSTPYNSVCFSVMMGGELTVNGGNYKMINDALYSTGNTHGGWLGIVMNSGGTLILNDGTFENVPADGFNPAYERAIIEAENNTPSVSTVVFAGGKYKPQHSKVYSGYGDKYYPTWVNTEKLTLGEDGWYTVADNKGYVVNGDEYLVSTGAGLAAAVVDAPANAKITLTADVDLTDVAYTPRTFNSLVFNGNHHTISGVKVEGVDQAALFGKTWKFDIQNVTLANSTFSGNYGLFQGGETEDSAAGFIAFLQTYSAGSKLENCHIENCTIGSAKYVGGLVAYKNGDFAIELTNCSVKGSSFVSNYTEDGAKYKGHCGGLIGLTNNISIVNCVVANNTFDVLGARGGLFIGSAQHNSAVSGKVENNTGLLMLCGEVNNIADWSNVEYNFHASNAAELKAGIAANFKTIYIKGQIDLTEEILANYGGTIIGADDTACINTRTFNVISANEAYHLSDKTINFKNITIKVPTEDGDFLKTGFVAAGTMNFDNCVFEGQVTLNGHATWTFNECQFGGADNGAYASFVYAATKVTFNDCSFSGVDRAAKIYGVGGTIEAEYNNCTFTSTTSNKYAVNIDASYATTNVALNGCSQTGMPGLFAVTGSKANVTVDGEIVAKVGWSSVNGYSKLFVNADKSEYTVFSAEGLIQLNNYWAANAYSNHMWGKKYSIGADIDATGHTWNSVFVIVGNNANDGFVIDGNGHTIRNLAINGSLFTGTPNGSYAGTTPGVVRNLTFDNATVANGGYGAAVIWGNTYGEVTFEDVHIVNSSITGTCNVAAFVGATTIEDGGTINPVKFINCSVENCAITAQGATECDPTGASGYVGRAFAKTSLVFEGTNTIDAATVINNAEGLVGGRVYGYTTWANGGFSGTGASDDFVNWNGLN